MVPQIKQFKLIIKKENITYHYGYDGNFIDALADLELKPGEIIIHHYGGFSQRWGRSTFFKFNKEDKTFYLAKDEYTTFNATDQENTTVDNNYTEKDFGKIKLSDFDINIEINH